MVRQNHLTTRPEKKAAKPVQKRKFAKTMDGRARNKNKVRLTEKEVGLIVDLIKEFETGQRVEPITWELLAELTGRPDRTLSRNDDIYNSYVEAKAAQSARRVAEKAGKRVRPKVPTDVDQRILELERELANRDTLITQYDNMFERLIRNGLKKGINVQELLDTPLKPKVTRKTLRGADKGQETRIINIVQENQGKT